MGAMSDPIYKAQAFEIAKMAENVRTLEAENAKLRELVKRYHRLVTGTDELWSWQSVYAELQELGIEVNK